MQVGNSMLMWMYCYEKSNPILTFRSCTPLLPWARRKITHYSVDRFHSLSFARRRCPSLFFPSPSLSSFSLTPKFQSIVKVDGTWKGQSSGAGRRARRRRTEWDLPRESRGGQRRQLKIIRDRFTVNESSLLGTAKRNRRSIPPRAP